MDNTINFLGIGAQKAGTSWLYKMLKKHPDIWLPPIKELHYFDRNKHYPSPSFLHTDNCLDRLNSYEINDIEFKKKLVYNLMKSIELNDINQIKWYLKYFLSTYNDTWYKSLFENIENLSGEITPAYSFLNIQDIQRIYNINPKIKLILILRNPIDRAWSQISFYIRIKQLPQNITIKEMKTFIDSKEQILRGDYIKIINNWLQIFPKEQIHIGFYDEIMLNPQNFLNKIFSFLNIQNITYEESFLTQRVNATKAEIMPIEIKEYLKEIYEEEIRKLSQLIHNDYTNQWI